MKEKRQHDGSGILIFLVAAIAVIAVAFIAVGILMYNDEEIPVQTSGTVPAEPVTEKSVTTDAVTEPTVLSTETSALSETETKASATVSETTTETPADTSEDTKAPETENTAAPENTEAPAVTSSAAETTQRELYTYDKSYFSNDLFIGDSIYTGLYLYEYFPESQVFAKMGMNPQSVRTASVNGYTAKQKVAAMKPAHIFIMLGTNGLAYMSPSLMANEMKAFVGELKSESSDSSIYVVSIPPVTYAHELKGKETMEMVNKYNGLLEAAAADSGAVFLDLCSQLKNDNGYFSSQFAEADGMHFLGSAYKQMLGYFYKETGGASEDPA